VEWKCRKLRGASGEICGVLDRVFRRTAACGALDGEPRFDAGCLRRVPSAPEKLDAGL
jgi:hypothetical protein